MAMISPELLRRYPHFAKLEDDVLKKLAMMSEERAFARAGTPVRGGAACGQFLYVILQGSVDLFSVVGTGERRVVDTLVSGRPDVAVGRDHAAHAALRRRRTRADPRRGRRRGAPAGPPLRRPRLRLPRAQDCQPRPRATPREHPDPAGRRGLGDLPKLAPQRLRGVERQARQVLLEAAAEIGHGDGAPGAHDRSEVRRSTQGPPRVALADPP